MLKLRIYQSPFTFLKDTTKAYFWQCNTVGSKVKGLISKRVFQENTKHAKFFEKRTFFFLETPVLRFAVLPYYR